MPNPWYKKQKKTKKNPLVMIGIKIYIKSPHKAKLNI